MTGGEWDEAEKYLSGFTKVDDNRYSMKIFFEIRKQKYLEALDRSVFVDINCDDMCEFCFIEVGSDVIGLVLPSITGEIVQKL